MARLSKYKSFAGNLTHIVPLINKLKNTTKVIWMLQGGSLLPDRNTCLWNIYIYNICMFLRHYSANCFLYNYTFLYVCIL